MKNGRLPVSKFLEHLVLAAASSAFAYFAWWTWRDIKREKRPEVTEEMIDDAFNQMLEEHSFEPD